MDITAIVSLISLFGPKILSLIEGLFHKKDTQEETVATLATTNPDALAKYVEAQAKLAQVSNESVNADITGTVAPWVSNIRAMIRPSITLIAACHIVFAWIYPTHTIPPEAMTVYSVAISSWFGSKLIGK
jgi:hypothetical protein